MRRHRRLKDGIIDDPRRCTFDPAKLLCKSGADEATCLTPPQVDAVKKVYEGVKNPRTGEQIFTGWPRGSEGFGDAPGQSWRQYIMDPPEPMRVGFFKYFLFHDPNWDYRTIDWERDLAYAERLPYMPAVDRDLTPFKKSGGKLLMYTGWADPVVPPQDTVAYYDAVVKTMGGWRRRASSSACSWRRAWATAAAGPDRTVRHPDGARAVGRERRRAGQADRVAQHQRQGRPHTSAVPLSAGRALQRHRQHRRGRELRVRDAGSSPAAGARPERCGDRDRREFKRRSRDGAAVAGAADAGCSRSRHFFPRFEARKIQTSGATINVLRGGSGPPLLLIHGYPQTHVEWHKIAPRLARSSPS